MKATAVIVGDYKKPRFSLSPGDEVYLRANEDGLVIAKLTDKDMEKIADLVIERLKMEE